MKSIYSKLSALSAALVLVSPVCAGVAVIGNPNLHVGSVSSKEIQRVYLGKTSNLGETYVIPIDQSPGSSAREQFYSNVVDMTETEAKSYWSRIIFTGKGQPPQQESSDSSVKELVAQNPNFIGYIDESAVDGSVKVLLHVK